MALAWFAASLLPAQEPANFDGTVINSATHEPIPKASVLLRSRDGDKGTNYAAETDANGKFSIRNMVPGSYSMTANRLGFFAEVTGAPGATPKATVVSPGESIKNFIIHLTPACVIAGRVLDHDGDPVRGANVQAMRYTYSGGKKQLSGVMNNMAGDKGEYRLFGLQPGTYYVRAMDNSPGIMTGRMGVRVGIGLL